MKRFFSALAAISAALAVAYAEDTPVSFNWGAITHYRDRDRSETQQQPALQRSVDDAPPDRFGNGSTWPSKKSFGICPPTGDPHENGDCDHQTVQTR